MHNRILNEQDRKQLQPLIEEMFKTCPEMMSRKIPEANIQQAYIIREVLKKYRPGDKVLCVGVYEDTAYEYLKTKGIEIVGIDPQVNTDLRTFAKQTTEKFHIIFSTSTIEHVANDAEFIQDICNLLEVGGYAFLTADFREDYKPGIPKPSVDYRLYTSADYKRLSKVAGDRNCFFLDELIPDVTPYFHYENADYSFSTMVFKKLR